MTQGVPSPSLSSDDSEEGNNASPISSPTASQFEARPRTTSRLSLFADSGNSDSHANAPPQMPVVRRKSVRVKPSPSAKPFGDDVKPSPLPPKRCGAENSDSEGKKKQSRKGGTDGEVEAIERGTRAFRDDDQKISWTEEDVIGLLRALVAYIRQKDSTDDIRTFLRSISDSLHLDVEESELLDKVKNLRKEYEEKAEKASDGKELVFKGPHEQKVYEISRDIWGGEGDKKGDDKDQESFGSLAKDSSGIGEEDANTVVKDDVKEEVLEKRPRLFISERTELSGALLRGMIKHGGTFNSSSVINKLLISIEPPKGKNLADIEDEVCGKALEAYINWLDHHLNSTKLALKALRTSKEAKF